MKDVIIGRIKKLLVVNDLGDWSEYLGSFLEAYCAHPAMGPAFAAIRKKKLKEHKPFYQAYQSYADELSRLLKELESELKDFEDLPPFPWQIINETPSSINLDDPFYQPELLFFNACKSLRIFL